MDFESSDQISSEIRKLRGDDKEQFYKWANVYLRKVRRKTAMARAEAENGYNNNDERIE
jgi:hypothetical protein